MGFGNGGAPRRQEDGRRGGAEGAACPVGRRGVIAIDLLTEFEHGENQNRMGRAAGLGKMSIASFFGSQPGFCVFCFFPK